MDDLTKISGIGAATAKKLVAGGIDSFAKLAAATPAQIEDLRISGDAADHQKLIAAAAELAPKTIDLATASDEQIAAQAAKIETARLQLAQHADSAVTAFGNLNAAKGGSHDAFAAAETAFNGAIAAVHGAVAEARALLGVPDDAPLPPALLEELASLQEMPPFVPQIEWSGATEGAAAAQAGGTISAEESDTESQFEQSGQALLFSERQEAHSFLEQVIARARAAAAAGELAEAGEFLRDNRREIQAGQVLLAEMLSGINAEIESLDQIQVTAPVEHALEVTATVDSRWRIGRNFGKTATTFEAGELGADELLSLKADPLLVVTELR